MKPESGFIPRGLAREASSLSSAEAATTYRTSVDLVWKRIDSAEEGCLFKSYGSRFTSDYRIYPKRDYYNAFQYRFNQKLIDDCELESKFNNCASLPYWNIFQSQLLKDSSMAWKICSILGQDDLTSDCKIVVLAGLGHVEFGCCVPRAVAEFCNLSNGGKQVMEDCLISCVGINEEEEASLKSKDRGEDSIKLGGTRFADYFLKFKFSEE